MKVNFIKVIFNNLFILITALLLVLIFFFRVLFIDKTILFISDIQLDFTSQFYSAQLMKEGMSLLWDPYHYGHYVAYYTSALFYPLNILMRFMFQVNNIYLSFRIFEYFIMFHYFLAFCFMYLLMRTLKISKIASYLSAITYSFSGFMICQMIHAPIMQAAAWVPLLFTFAIKSVEKKTFYIISVAIVLAVMFLSGHPQPTIYYCYLLLIFYIYKSYLLWKHNLMKEPKVILKPVVLIFSCFLLTVGIIAIQLFPIFELIPQGLRHHASYEQMNILGSVTMPHLISFILPNFFGGDKVNYWGFDFEVIGQHETNYYMGICTFVLLVFVILLAPIISKKYKYLNFFLITALVSLLWMLGRNTILSAWFYLLPGLNKVRIASRVGALLNFSLAVIIGYGFDINYKKGFLIKRMLNKNKMLFISIELITVSWMAIFFFNIYHNQSISTDSLQYARLVNIYRDIIRFAIIFNLLIGIIWILINIKKIYFRNIFIAVFMIIALVDIFSYQIGFNPRSSFPDDPLLPFKDKSISSVEKITSSALPKQITEDKDFFRVRMVDIYDTSRYASLNKIFSLGYGGTSAIFRLCNFRDQFEQFEPPYSIKDPNSPLLDFYNVKYLYSFYKLDKTSSKYQSLPGHPNWYINNSAFPRAFCVFRYSVLSNDEWILENMKYIDLRKQVLLTENPELKIYDYSKERGSLCKIESYSNNKVKISADMKSPGFVVLSDVWYPGWKAYIDGKITKIYRANYIFRAVAVPKGKHNIMLIFDPFSFKLGAVVTLATILLLIAIGIRSLLSRNQHEA